MAGGGSTAEKIPEPNKKTIHKLGEGRQSPRTGGPRLLMVQKKTNRRAGK
jgi:hypothetical protein